MLVNEVQNKIPDINNLATKTALTTFENKIPDISSLVKQTSLDHKVNKIKSDVEKAILKVSSLLIAGNIFFSSEDGNQACLIFQPVYRYFKTFTNTKYILSWKSKGLSAESITSDNSLTPELSYVDYRIRVKFTGSCLKQPKITYTHKKW